MSLQWTAVATFLYAEVFAVLLLCIPFISPKRYGPWGQAGRHIRTRLLVAKPQSLCVCRVGSGARQKQVGCVWGGGGMCCVFTIASLPHRSALSYILPNSFPVHPASGLLNGPKGKRPSSSYDSGNNAFLLPLGSLGFGGWQCGIQKTCTTGSRCCLFGDFCPTKLVSLALRSGLMSITQPLQGEAIFSFSEQRTC